METNIINFNDYLNKRNSTFNVNFNLDNTLKDILNKLILDEISDFKNKLNLSTNTNNIEATKFNKHMIKKLKTTLKQLKENSNIDYANISILLGICELRIERISLEILFLNPNSKEFCEEDRLLKNINTLYNILKDIYNEYINQKRT